MHRPMPINWLTRERTGQSKVSCHGHVPQTVRHFPKAGDRSSWWFVFWFPKTGERYAKEFIFCLIGLTWGGGVGGTPHRKADPTAQAKCHIIPSPTQESGSKKSVLFVKLSFQGCHYSPCASLSSTTTAPKSELPTAKAARWTAVR